MSDADLTPVSMTDGDRVLTGVGADPEQLAQTMQRHATDEAPEPQEVQREPQEAQGDAQPQQPKQTRGQKRFDQLTKEREQERERREAVERERDELRSQLASRSAVVSPEPTRTAPQSAVSTNALPTEPDFEKQYEALIGTKYQTYGAAVQAFNRDYAQWSQADIDARIRTGIEADRASRSEMDRARTEVQRAIKLYPDFGTIANAPHLTERVWPAAIREAVNSLPEPEHVRYRLGKDPELAEKIRTMNPILAIQAIAQLVPASAVASPASTASAGSVTPPPPYQPVGAGSKTTTPASADLVKRGGFDFDKSGYREKRAAERGVRRR